jgi:hypothetical protein
MAKPKAKQEKLPAGALVAKRNFDDGTNRIEGEKSKDYQAGDAYKGTPEEAKIVYAKGLLCTVEEYSMKDKVVSAKDAEIESLNNTIEDLRAALTASEKKIEELQKALGSKGIE